jgi:integrase/recombinase XerD
MHKGGVQKNTTPIGNPNDPETLYYYMLRFLQHCETIHVSARTIEGRRTHLRGFIIWCDERSLAHPADITRPILERYQRHLFLKRKDNGEPLSIAAQQGYILSIRACFKWLTKSNHILYNPASELDIPRIPKRLPKDILSPSEVEQLLNQPDLNTAAGIKDRVIMEVLYSTGIRRLELCNIKVNDINMEKCTLMVVQGKGRKDRMIPIGQRAITWVRKYLEDVRPEFVTVDSNNYLFLNIYGDITNANWLSNMVTKYMKKSKLGKKGSCHLFRHTMASLMLENGADIRYIQMILGHSNIETTQIYTQVSIQKLIDIHTATHPGKNKKPEDQPKETELSKIMQN